MRALRALCCTCFTTLCSTQMRGGEGDAGKGACIEVGDGTSTDVGEDAGLCVVSGGMSVRPSNEFHTRSMKIRSAQSASIVSHARTRCHNACFSSHVSSRARRSISTSRMTSSLNSSNKRRTRRTIRIYTENELGASLSAFSRKGHAALRST